MTATGIKGSVEGKGSTGVRRKGYWVKGFRSTYQEARVEGLGLSLLEIMVEVEEGWL